MDIGGFIGQDLGPTIEPQCDENGRCDPDSPFRSYTGYCNNLRNPNLGKSLTTFARLLPPVYEDGKIYIYIYIIYLIIKYPN